MNYIGNKRIKNGVIGNKYKTVFGTYLNKQGKYTAQCNTGDIHNRNLGSYNTELEAFYIYKVAKESYIKQVADEYKQKYPNFPEKLYNAMYSWKVEITD